MSSLKHNFHEIELMRKKCIVQTIQEAFIHWQQRQPYYLFISLKNPKFSGDLIDWFVQVCNKHDGRGHICIVDSPYIQNEQAKLGRSLNEKEVQKIYILSNERNNQVNHILRRFSNPNITCLIWDNLVDETPIWIRDEIRCAFTRQSDFYEDTIRHIKNVRHSIRDTRQLHQYAEFILEELPTLIYIYYQHKNGIVDFYPGENMPFFEQLEQQTYSNELRKITEFIQQSSPLVYVNVL